MLDTCITLLKESIDFISKQKDKRKEKKLQISVVLQEISELLKNTGDMLSEDKYPSFNCALMEKMSNHLMYHLSGLLPEEQLKGLHKSLIEASQVEKQFTLRKEAETIPKIYEASAEFKSLSLFLKI